MEFGTGSVSGTGNMQLTTGIGFNSTSVASGFAAGSGVKSSAAINLSAETLAIANYLAAPSLGINTITMLEKFNGAIAITAQGTEATNLLSALWEG
jgi:hypothetical protein